MQHDTPLTEVAHHLPSIAAGVLSDISNPVVQELVLKNVRSFVVAIEDRGVELDALEYDAVLSAFVACQIAWSQEGVELYWRLQQAFQLSQEIAAMTRMQA